MKKFGRPPRRDETPSARTGPRARAAQERRFADPYQRAERPERPADSQRDERMSRPAVIRLDPDVARIFRDSEAVNEALRLVLRLARLAGGRSSFARERGGGFGGREGAGRRPDRDAAGRRPERGEPRPRPRRFEEEK